MVSRFVQITDERFFIKRRYGVAKHVVATTFWLCVGLYSLKLILMNKNDKITGKLVDTVLFTTITGAEIQIF